jgi:hypothetical protein
MFLVAEVDNLLVAAFPYTDRDAFPGVVRDEIHCALDCVEIAGAVGGDRQLCGVGAGRHCPWLGREAPTFACGSLLKVNFNCTSGLTSVAWSAGNNVCERAGGAMAEAPSAHAASSEFTSNVLCIWYEPQ